MPRSDYATHNLCAVSALDAETAINTPRAPDTTLLVALGDILNPEPRREANKGEATGLLEPDRVDDLGAMASMPLTFDKCQPQHAAFVMGYALGSVTTSSAGAGYLHTLRPRDGDLDYERSVPSFTLAQRVGKTMGLVRAASCFIDSFSLSLAKDSWVKLTGQVKATGLLASAMVEETVTAAENVESLTLAANGVAGATAAERLDAVHLVQAQIDGVWRNVAYSAASDATPAVVTITAPGEGTDDISYRVLYLPATLPAWATFPARVSESPLRISEMQFQMGGAWDGSALVGGRDVSNLVESIDWTYNNALAVEFSPGAGGSYASRALAGERSQTLKVNKRLRDWALQTRQVSAVEYFAARVLCEGAVYDDPHKFQIEIVWPRLALLAAPMSVNGQRVAEAGDLQVLQDATYGSVVARIKNQVARYAA